MLRHYLVANEDPIAAHGPAFLTSQATAAAVHQYLEHVYLRRPARYSPEVVQQALRMVQEARSEYGSQWAAITSVAAKVGCTSETLRRWVRKWENDSNQQKIGTPPDNERLLTLERENKELRKANEILRLTSAFFAKAELERSFKS